MRSTVKRVLTLAFFAALAALPASADSFTSSTAFSAAIAGMSGVTTANFDADAVGNIAQGATVDGITFTSTINGGAGSLAIANLFNTTSGTNYLGSDDPTTAALFGGDSITMTFASPVNALGLFIIGGPYTDGDFTLASIAATALSSSTLEQTLPDGGEVIFLGITSATGFSSATLSLSLTAGELWNVDDITTAGGTSNTGGGGGTPVPEPGTLAMLLAGLCACTYFSCRRSAEPRA